MAHSCSCRPNTVTKVSTEVSGIAGLLTEIFCACGEETRIEVGNMACEMFRRVDLKGEHLETVAHALGVDPEDATPILAVVRGNVAKAFVEVISAGTIPNPRG